MIEIGLRIKEQREEKGLSQRGLAQKIGLKANTISQYESGLRKPSYETLISLADFFKVTTDYLLGREDY